MLGKLNHKAFCLVALIQTTLKHVFLEIIIDFGCAVLAQESLARRDHGSAGYEACL